MEGRCASCGTPGYGSGLCASCSTANNVYQAGMVNLRQAEQINADLYSCLWGRGGLAHQLCCCIVGCIGSAHKDYNQKKKKNKRRNLDGSLSESLLDTSGPNVDAVREFVDVYNSRDEERMRGFVETYFMPDYRSTVKGFNADKTKHDMVAHYLEAWGLGRHLTDLMILRVKDDEVDYSYATRVEGEIKYYVCTNMKLGEPGRFLVGPQKEKKSQVPRHWETLL